MFADKFNTSLVEGISDFDQNVHDASDIAVTCLHPFSRRQWDTG